MQKLESSSGRTVSEETRQKISTALKGHKVKKSTRDIKKK